MTVINRRTGEMEPRVTEMKCDLTREGRLLSVFKDDSTLAVFRLQATPENLLDQPIWETDNVKSSVWHHEESRILLSKRNGDLEWKSFQRNLTFTIGRLSAEQLLKHLIAKQLEFDSLKNIRCLAFQRDFCILQTSTRQIVALQWKSNLTTNIVWGLKINEFAAWTFCDKLFIDFEPHTKNLHLYSIFNGKVKKTVQLEFSDNGATSPVRRIAACPNGRTFALLTDQLFIGDQKLHLLLPDGRTVTHFSLGTERIAVFTKQPDEYLLYDYSTLQKVCSYSLRPEELMMVSGQQFDRADKVMNASYVLRDLMELNQADLVVHIDVRPSLLSTALSSRHLESSANVLKIAERCDETETCRILQVLNQFIQSNDKGSPFVLQILGLALGFAGRAFKTFPDCATIFNLIYEWQELLPVETPQPLAVQTDPAREQFFHVWKDMDAFHVVEHALLHNCLPLAQQFMMQQDPCQFRNLKDIRQLVLTRLQEVTSAKDAQSMEHAATLISKLVTIT